MPEHLKDRLERAYKTLQTMAEEAPLRSEQHRLHGKAEGVQLALSYLREGEAHA